MSFRKLTHSGNILLAGFGGMLMMMTILVYLAVKQDIPMVSKNYYEQELVYQQKLDAIRNTEAYDAGFSVLTTGNQVTVQIPPALAEKLTGGSVYFYCPAKEQQDRRVTLVAGQTGTYSFPVDIKPGLAYQVQIAFRSGNTDYYKELKLN